MRTGPNGVMFVGGWPGTGGAKSDADRGAKVGVLDRIEATVAWAAEMLFQSARAAS
jgi:hypothetical protein